MCQGGRAIAQMVGSYRLGERGTGYLELLECYLCDTVANVSPRSSWRWARRTPGRRPGQGSTRDASG